MKADADSLWRRLETAGLVSGAPPAVPLESPWYVRLMLGFAGWMAALFLLGFVAAGFAWIVESENASIGTGLLLMAAAWFLFQKLGRNDFAAQFALALSFAGQSLYAVGVFGLFGESERAAGPWWWMALLQTVLLVLMPSAVHRLWSGFAAAGALYGALHALGFGFLAPPLMLAGAAWAWLSEFRWPRKGIVLRPAAYGLVLALVAIELVAGPPGTSVGLEAEPAGRRLLGQLLNGAVLFTVVWILLRRSGARWPGRTCIGVLAGTLGVVLVSLEAPGIASGLCMLRLGFAHGNAVLGGIGGTALLLYAGGYYYELDTTLLVKSQVMAATGVVLLLFRWALLRWIAPGDRNG